MSERVMMLEAKRENLDELLDYVEKDIYTLEETMQIVIKVALEEIFVNIASYAYDDGGGNVVFRVGRHDEPLRRLVFTFIDSGTPYNPLKKEKPDFESELSERKIGGLGIYMVKETMDDMIYDYRDGRNVLTIIKNF